MIWFKGNTISYKKFVDYVELLARALVGSGVKKGDRVALMMPNCPQIIISQFAVWRAGGITAQVNPLFSEEELTHALKDCGAETVIVLTPFYSQVKKVQPQTNVKRVIATSIKEYLSPFMRAMFTLLMEKKQGHRIELQPGDLWFQEITAEICRGAATPHFDWPPGYRPHPFQRRHHWSAQGCDALASRHCHERHADPRLDLANHEGLGR